MKIEFDKPMLACSLLESGEPHTDVFILEKMKILWKMHDGPRIATLKKDGIRGVVLGDLASRTCKKIPNRHLQCLSKALPYGLDTELADLTLQYDQNESIIMSGDHVDSYRIQFHILDLWDETQKISYTERLHIANYLCEGMSCVVPAEPVECKTPYDLLDFFKSVEEEKGEGICWRLPDSLYVQKGTKDNRSTFYEQYLFKLTRPIRAECVVVGFEEQMLNTNPVRRNANGKMDRSKAEAGMVGKCTLGAFLVRDANGLEFRIGSGVGLTAKKRDEIWDKRGEWLGKTIVYQSKSHGVKVKPRSPIYVGERKEIDIV